MAEGDLRLIDGAVNEAIARPAVKERFAKLGVDPLPKSSAESAAFIHHQTQLWQKLIRDAKVTID